MPEPREIRRFGVIVGCAVVLVAASQALGNPGTAGWTVIAHMIVGNLVIGIVEGVIAARLGAGWWAVPALVVANYLSAGVGMAVAKSAFEPVVAALGDDPLRAVGPASWLAMACWRSWAW